MSLGRSSRFYFFGPAKSEIGESVIFLCICILHHYSSWQYVVLPGSLTRLLVKLDEYGNAQVFESMRKQITPCVVFNKVIHIIHSNLGMPFYRNPPNDRSRIALGWYKEFQ